MQYNGLGSILSFIESKRKRSPIMSQAVKRLQFVDMVKGIAIIHVVFFHLLAASPVKSYFNHTIEIILVTFFFFSGYFHKPGKKSLGENLKSRAKALLVPFFKYSLFFWAVGTIYLVASGSAPVAETFYCLRNFYGGCIWNRTIQNWFQWDYYQLGKRYLFLADFWFLLTMLFASIVFFLIVDHVIKSKAKTIVVSAVLFALTGVLRAFAIDLPYNFQLVPFWAAFMLLGAFAGYYHLFDSEKLTGAKEWVLSILTLAAGITISLLQPENLNMFRGTFPENEIVNMLLCIAASLLAIWGLGVLCKKIEQTGVRIHELAWLGSHSLLIYLYHMFFFWILCTILGIPTQYPEDPSTTVILQSVLITVTVLALCILRYVFADILIGKYSKDPSVWGKGRWFACAIVLGAIALGCAGIGFRAAEKKLTPEEQPQQTAAYEITSEEFINHG